MQAGSVSRAEARHQSRAANDPGRWVRVSLAGAAARGGAVTLAGQLIRAIVQLATIAVLARLLPPSDFGLYTMVVAVVGIAAVLGDFGLSMAAIQSQTITHAQRSNLFWTNAAIGLALMGAVLLAAPWLAMFYDEPSLTYVTEVMSVTFLLNALAAQFRAEVSIKLRFRWLAIADVLAVTVALGVAVTVASLGLGVWALVAQQITIAIITLLVMVAGAAWWPGRPRRGTDMRELYRYGANTLGVQLFTYITGNVDSVLIGRVWGANSLGLYDRAYQLFRLPLQQIGAPMTKVAVPVLSKLQADERFTSYVLRAQVVLAYTFGGTFFILAALSDPLIEIVLGPAWATAKPIFAVLAIGGVFQGIGYVYYWVFLSRALTGLQLRWTIIGRSAMVVAMVVGVFWGPLGVAVGSTCGLVLNWLLLTAFPMGRSGVPRRPLIAIALRPLLLLTPVTVISMVLSYGPLSGWNAWLELVTLLGLIVLYLAASAAVPHVRADAREIMDVIRRLRHR